MKQTIVILFFIIALASCKERTGTAPAPIPPPAPVTPTPATVTKLPYKPDEIPYSFSLLYPESPEGWCGKPHVKDIIDSIEKYTRARGIYSGHNVDEWGRVSVVVHDTTARKWSLNTISSYNHSLCRDAVKIIEQNAPDCQRLYCAYYSRQYRHWYNGIAVSFDTLYPSRIKDKKIRNKLLRVKRGFQQICNSLKPRFKTYDNVTAELYTVLKDNKKYGLAVFELPIDSVAGKITTTDRKYRQEIPALIAQVKAVDPFFTRVQLDYNGDYAFKHLSRDTVFSTKAH